MISISAARVLIDYKTGQSVLVDIQAAFAIPILRSYGEVTIVVNDDGALLEGEIQFLAVLNPYVKIEWDVSTLLQYLFTKLLELCLLPFTTLSFWLILKWAFNNFYAELGNIVFAPGVLELNELVLNVTTQPSIVLFFEIDITVLSFADLGASLLIEESSDGQDLSVDFTLVVDAELVETTVKGDATLDLVTIEDTEFGSFDVSVAWGGAAEAVAEFVEGAVTAIADGITNTVNAVGDAIVEIGEAILGFIDEAPFIGAAFDAVATGVENFRAGLQDLVTTGDPAALAQAAITFANDFANAFNEVDWEDVGNTIVDGLEDAGLFITNGLGISSQSDSRKTITLSEKDQWGCNYIRTDVTTKTCWKACLFGCKTCSSKTEQGTKQSDATCVADAQILLEETRAKLETAGTIGTGSKTTTDGNAAILREDRANLPSATFDDLSGSVPYSKDCSSVSLKKKITGSTKILDNSAAEGISNSDESFQTDDMVDVDFTPPSCNGNARRLNADGSFTSQAYLDSLLTGIDKLKQQVNQTVNKDMTGVDPSIKAYQEDVEPIPLKIGFDNNPNDQVVAITCSEFTPNLAISKRPRILTSDPDCKTTLVYTKFSETVDVPKQYLCGTVELTRRWTVSDTCGQSDYVDQFIYLQPRAPIWTETPWSTPVSDT